MYTCYCKCKICQCIACMTYLCKIVVLHIFDCRTLDSTRQVVQKAQRVDFFRQTPTSVRQIGQIKGPVNGDV